MRKKKREQHIYDNSEADERRYLQKLKADQSMLQAFFSSIPQSCCVPFYYPYGYPVYPQTDMLVKQPEDNVNKDCLKNKKNK